MEFFCGPSASSSSSSSSAARRPRASAGTTSSSSSSRDESRQWPRSSLPPRPQAPPARNDRASAAEKTASRHSQPHKSTTNGRPSSYAPAPHRAEFAPGAGTNSSSASSSSSSTSSRSNAASASASSSTHPSPSTSNSLRTPPDVAPRGLSSSAVGGNATKVGNINNKRHTLTMAEIDQRLKLLDTLAGDIDVSIPALPRPGGTAKPEAAAAAAAAPSSSAMSRAGSSDSKQKRLASTSSSLSTSKKRAGQDQKDIAEEDGSIEPPRKKTRARASTNRDYTPSPSPEPKAKVAAVAKMTPASSAAQKPVAWTKDKLSSAASYYQSKARSLKHSSDRTLREAVAPDSASVLAQRQAAVFGQTDAVLLYVYAFWCEDALATLNAGSSVDGPTVIVSNWRSMLDLVKFVAAKHERRREWALAALCHLVEGLLLRHISAYESRQVQRNLSRLAAASATASATSAAHSPAGEAPSPAARSDGTMTTAASPPVTTVSNATDVHGALVDLSTNLARVLRDEAWGTKLVAQARSSSSSSSSASSSTTPVGALSNTSLARDFPQTWATCLRGALVRGDAWSSAPSMNPAAFAKGRDDDREEGEADEEQGDGAAVWAWPFIEASGAAGAPGAAQSSDEATRLAHSLPGACLPHLVCFGRKLLRERAARTGLKEFRLADLDEPPATSGRNGK